MPRIKGPRKVKQYSNEFKVTAVLLSHLPGVQVKDVAEELDIHYFMLSLWRRKCEKANWRHKRVFGLVKELGHPSPQNRLGL